jgi:hypothetical protein
VRVIACQLPVKAPWLNPVEPKWVHGKRAVVEPVRLLTAAELEERICTYFGANLRITSFVRWRVLPGRKPSPGQMLQ